MRYSVVGRLMLLGLVIVMGSVYADNHHSKKTFLMSRPQGVNLAMEYTTWHDHVYNGKKHICTNSCDRPCVKASAPRACAPRSCNPCGPRKINASFQATGFYQDSTNHEQIGKYFGIGNGKNSFVVGTEAQVTAGTADILNGFLIHDNGGQSNLAGKVSFNPHQQAAGVRFDYFQSFNTPICGLFFKARLPLVSVERDMQLRVDDSVNSPAGFSLQDFFKGNVEETNAGSGNLQDKLTKAKIDGRRHKFGVADIDLALGHKFVDTDTKHLFLNVGITIPTGSKVRGEFLFEPVVGNGQHFGIGGGLDAGVLLWCNENASLRFLAAAEYRYLFERTEHRTVGVKDLPLGYYYLAGELGKPADTPLFPAANVLTQGLKVKPGSQFDSLIALSFKSSGFIVDVGYNLFWKDREDVWLKHWDDDTFIIPVTGFDTNAILDAADAFKTLNKSDLDVSAAATPSLFTHKIFAGLGYTTKVYCDYPLSFGVGGSYEFGTSNADLENYAVWAKIAVSV